MFLLNEKFKNLKFQNQFIKHNNFYFKKKKSNKIFLVEFNRWQGLHVAFSYIANFFVQKKNCNIVAFKDYDLLSPKKPNFIENIKWFLGSKLKIKNFGVYSSFGTDKFIKPNYTKKIRIKAKKQFYKFYKKKKTLNDLEDFCLEKIWIGDLIYDSYLKKNSMITIDIDSENFKSFFLEALNLFYFWIETFKNNNIKGVLVCHSVYISGIPLRIANHKKILSFYFNGANFFNITNRIIYKNRINGTDISFRYYKKIFTKFNKRKKHECLLEGKKYLENIIQGNNKYYYVKNLSFSKKNNFKFLLNDKFKIVIYPHLFNDSVHTYGNHLFPDYFKWLEFLKLVIKTTNYDWYIKRHPDEDLYTKKIINQYVNSLTNLKSIPSNISNSFIGKNIDFALTLYGTIASELSYYGVKVISASRNNPHINYKFSINPKNFSEYRKFLLNLDKIKFKINKNELYEFHYMKNYFSPNNSYFFPDTHNYFKFNSYRQVFLTYEFYDIWLRSFLLPNHNEMLKKLENFVKSKDYMILPHHKKNYYSLT